MVEVAIASRKKRRSYAKNGKLRGKYKRCNYQEITAVSKQSG